MGYSRRHIANADLREEQIPPSADDDALLLEFASTFDGDQFYHTHLNLPLHVAARKVSRLTLTSRATFLTSGTLPKTLSEMRVCLFGEARFRRSQPGDGAYPYFAGSAWAGALLDGIRAKIRAGQLD